MFKRYTLMGSGPVFIKLILFSVSFLAGCIRVSSPSETPLPSGSATLPLLETLIVEETAAITETPSLPSNTPEIPNNPNPENVDSTIVVQASRLPPLSLNRQWRFQAEKQITSIDLTSLDGGPLLDIVAGSTNGMVYTLGLNLEEYWRQQFDEPVQLLVTADLDRDNIGDVLVASGNTVTVLEGGEIRWQFDGPAAITTILPVDPLEFGGASLIVGVEDGTILALDAGKSSLWNPSFKLDDVKVIQLTLAVLSNGAPPVLLAGLESGRIGAVNSTGSILWQVEVGEPLQQFVTADYNNDGLLDLAASNDEGVIAVEQSGRELWRWSSPEPVAAISLSDLDENGLPELIVGNESSPGLLSLLDNGRLLWQYALTEGGVRHVASQDLDNDGQLEIIAGGGDGTITILDQAGGLRGSFNTGEPVAGFKIADMDRGLNNSKSELVVWAGPYIYLLGVEEKSAAESPETPISPTPNAARPTPPPPVVVGELPHYEIQVTLDTVAHTAQVLQKVTLTNDTPDNWDEIIFNIPPAYWPGIFTLNSTTLSIDGTAVPIDTRLDSTMLSVLLPQSLTPEEQAAVEIDFSLTLPRVNRTAWGPAGNAGWGSGLVQMGEWYPSLVPYLPGVGWQTWQFSPVGDPVVYGLADFDVAIEVPAGVTIAAAGFVSQIESISYYHIEQARAFAFNASPEYIQFQGLASGVPVQVYVTSGYQAYGQQLLEAVIDAISLFAQRYGPYPYPEFVIAENGFLTSHEYSGFVSLGGAGFDAHNGRVDSILIAITAHEVAHQWWYGAVGNDQVYEPWLDESLAMLSELYFYEWYYPDLTDWWWQYRVDRWNPIGYVDVSIFEYNDSETFVHNMYGQASYFMQDLREMMGESAFQEFMRDYFRQNKNQFATGEKFFILAQAHTTANLASLRDRYFEK